MSSQMKKKTPIHHSTSKTSYNTNHDDATEQYSPHIHLCNNPCCFFCIMKEENPSLRRTKISTCFKEMPERDNQEHVLVLSGLWNIAMTQPNNPEFPSLGIFNCMAKLITKGTKNKTWLHTNQNIYIPYYAAHIIGSYTMNKEEFAQIAVKSGVIPPLLELLRGEISWVEQRVSVRALGHLASYNSTFESVAEYETELVKLTMNLASTCLEKIYVEFVSVERRVEYHRNLLTRGLGDLEMENRKAEEWTSQLQCWSIYLLNCFACKYYSNKSLNLICKKVFLNDLCDMWGGLMNHTSPGGFGLIRILCYNNIGRKKIAKLPKVLKTLCNLSRSCDDWQYLGIDCLLLLLKDQNTRYKVIIYNIDVVSCLVDLIELRSLGDKSNVGDTITKVLVSLLDDSNIDRKLKFSTNVISLNLKLIRRNKEKLMSEVKLEEKMITAKLIRKQANQMFSLGKVEEALLKYCEALDICPLKFRNERMVIYSKKAECNLLLKNYDSAISDSTRALCLSSPTNSHGKSLWRRSQAYDMKGMAKESLMDCIMFMNGFVKSNEIKNVKVPYHVAKMFCKQMDATWLFGSACSKSKVIDNVNVAHMENTCEIEDDHEIENEVSYEEQHFDHKVKMVEKTNFMPGLSTIIEEPFHAKEASRRKMERARRGLKKAVVD